MTRGAASRAEYVDIIEAIRWDNAPSFVGNIATKHRKKRQIARQGAGISQYQTS